MLRGCPVATRDLTVKGVPARANVELLKCKVLRHIQERFAAFDVLNVFSSASDWHTKYPPAGKQLEDSTDAGPELVVSTALMPRIPVWPESSKSELFKLCCEVIMLTGHMYQAFLSCSRNSGLVREIGMVTERLDFLQIAYNADLDPFKNPNKGVLRTPSNKRQCDATDLQDASFEDLEQLESEWLESKLQFLRAAGEAEMQSRGMIEPLLFSLDKALFTHRLSHSSIISTKLSKGGAGILYFYDLKQLSTRAPKGKANRMNMALAICKERLEFWMTEVFMAFARDDDIGVIMCGKSEHTAKKVLALLGALRPQLHCRVQGWLYSEDALRTGGLQRARYMLSLNPREMSILFAKAPIQQAPAEVICCNSHECFGVSCCNSHECFGVSISCGSPSREDRVPP